MKYECSIGRSKLLIYIIPLIMLLHARSALKGSNNIVENIALVKIVAASQDTSRYVDPKGNFALIPPDGWVRQDYPQDPRGKVAFTYGKARLGIITAVKDFRSYDELIRFCLSIEGKLGTKINTETFTFDGIPAVRRQFTYANQKQYMIDFIVGNVLHNIAFGAPANEFDRLLPKVLDSINSYEYFSTQYSDQATEEHKLAGLA
jgi:hypothetical protein